MRTGIFGIWLLAGLLASAVLGSDKLEAKKTKLISKLERKHDRAVAKAEKKAAVALAKAEKRARKAQEKDELLGAARVRLDSARTSAPAANAAATAV